MRSIVIASLFAIVALTGTAAQAEIMCTQHGGCLETGMRIIYGDGGGVQNEQHLNSYRNGKKQRVRIIRTYILLRKLSKESGEASPVGRL